MKRVFLTLVLALVAIVNMKAQQIAVVKDGQTTMCQTLGEAIKGAKDGSVIYLPAGGFQINKDSIKTRVTIIGVGHKQDSNNADGNTVVYGEICFNEGSSGSAVMGCYISGDVKIGYDGKSVNNVLVKYCNAHGVMVGNSNCTGTIVNQNYLRTASSFSGAEVTFTNNIAYWIGSVNGGKIMYNVFGYNSLGNSLCSITGSTISNNICYNGTSKCSNNLYQDNMGPTSFGNDFVKVSSWSGMFVNDAGITPSSDFHFTDAYSQYSYIGPYSTENGSTGFSDSAMPPVPYISYKSIPEQTDADGNLKIKIRVKASE